MQCVPFAMSARAAVFTDAWRYVYGDKKSSVSRNSSLGALRDMIDNDVYRANQRMPLRGYADIVTEYMRCLAKEGVALSDPNTSWHVLGANGTEAIRVRYDAHAAREPARYAYVRRMSEVLPDSAERRRVMTKVDEDDEAAGLPADSEDRILNSNTNTNKEQGIMNAGTKMNKDMVLATGTKLMEKHVEALQDAAKTNAEAFEGLASQTAVASVLSGEPLKLTGFVRLDDRRPQLARAITALQHVAGDTIETCSETDLLLNDPAAFNATTPCALELKLK